MFAAKSGLAISSDGLLNEQGAQRGQGDVFTCGHHQQIHVSGFVTSKTETDCFSDFRMPSNCVLIIYQYGCACDMLSPIKKRFTAPVLVLEGLNCPDLYENAVYGCKRNMV